MGFSRSLPDHRTFSGCPAPCSVLKHRSLHCFLQLTDKSVSGLCALKFPVVDGGWVVAPLVCVPPPLFLTARWRVAFSVMCPLSEGKGPSYCLAMVHVMWAHFALTKASLASEPYSEVYSLGLLGLAEGGAHCALWLWQCMCLGLSTVDITFLF